MKDKHKTKVRFYKELKYNSILAVFPDEPRMTLNNEGDNSIYYACYAHIGQHSECESEYLDECERIDNPEGYEDLKNELESIGYNLKVTK